MDGAKVGSLDDVPVNVALEALQKQVKELQELVTAAPPPPAAQPSGESSEEVASLKQQIKDLETLNAKAEYRIQILLRTLEQRDKLLNNSK
ncbi:hypothetical protein VTP01DRAFT_153 [Rhizomucor pusillus]|uniref:uncharacterized protein n=1 Tax=Rhizomucor pusillus TaxID=4840 RepID=UPI003743C8F9